MSAQEYYQSFASPAQSPPPPYVASSVQSNGRRPSLAPVQPQSAHNYTPQLSNYTPQQFLAPPGHQQWHPWSQPGSYTGYPPPVPYTGTPQASQSAYALVPSRSKSEPPEHRRTSADSYSGRHSSHPHSSHSSRRHSRSRSRSDRSHSRSRSRSRSRHHHRHNRERSHSGRDTFLGAGAGGLIGDALLPGLGTLFGALAGGVGGHEYASRKDGRRSSRSHSDSAGHGGGPHRYKDGITVNSGWIRR